MLELEGVVMLPSYRCDKCGRHVDLKNDAALFDSLLYRDISTIFATPRHLKPLVVNGLVVCDGSPSRAQYLKGQPRDSRAAYAYNPNLQKKYRKIWAEMQRDREFCKKAAAALQTSLT